MLFSREVDGVMMIDFERALLVKLPRLPLAQLVPNKRRRDTEVMDANGKPSRRRQVEFSEDIMMASLELGGFWARQAAAK